MVRILGLESSCDETAAALVEARPAGGRILASVVVDQAALHAAYGGVVPEIAARAHAERLDLAVAAALAEAGHGLDRVEAIAVTAGPGLIGGLLSGVMFAQGLGAALDLPVHGINHLAAHALTPRLSGGIGFPYLMLLVSGGHCQFLGVFGPDRFRRLGSTIDDAPGEAFDKVAKLLGLGFPGGPAVERLAAEGDPTRFRFPRPLIDRPGCDLSFSGLKTALLRARDQLVAGQGGLYRRDLADLAAGFQAAMVDTLTARTAAAIAAFRGSAGATPWLTVAGGVAANGPIRAALERLAAAEGFGFHAPPLALCTDNGAMVAWAAAERIAAGLGPSAADLRARPRWPLDETARPVIGSGRRGTKV